MKKFTVLALVLAMVVAMFAFTGCTTTEDEVLHVGLVCIGTTADKGYTYAHYKGLQYALEQINANGKKVELFVRDGVDDTNAEATTNAIESLINDDKCTLIFTNSFGFMDPTEAAAEKYPEVKFMHCSGYKSNDTNFGNYFGRAFQARYLAGIAAGYATKNNKIGYVAAMQLTEVYRGLNAFTLGVRSVNPDAKVYVTWTNTWYGPDIEKAAAKSLLDFGCDVIAQHQDTLQPGMAAAEVGAASCGYNSPMLEANPENYVTGPVFNWGYFYLEQIKAVLNNTWKVSTGWYGYESKFDVPDGSTYANGTGYVIGLDEYGPRMTDAAKAEIERVKALMIAGQFDVFAGPIKDNQGNIKVEEGHVMTDSEMLDVNFTWFVEGATDQLVD